MLRAYRSLSRVNLFGSDRIQRIDGRRSPCRKGCGYGWLFASTIKQNFRNRGVVLGVLTVGMFAGFLFYAYFLAGKYKESVGIALDESTQPPLL